MNTNNPMNERSAVREAYDKQHVSRGRWRNLKLAKARLFGTSPRSTLKGIVGT